VIHCGGFGAPQVLARIPGLTYRKLDYWSRTGRLAPHTHDPDGDEGTGIPFCWPLHQVEVAGRMFQLTQLGFNLDTADELAHNPARLAAVLDALQDLADGRTARRVAS
jgi:DNA-binding transcriptional MerR regulator